jgi:hypothetical protein
MSHGPCASATTTVRVSVNGSQEILSNGFEVEPELRRPNVGGKIMKSISADMIPEYFWRIRYDQNHDPNTPTLPSISDSPNCQSFVYALLKHFGFEIFPFRSSNLWQDSSQCYVVSDELRPLDLLLFNRTKNPWGAHVALHLGEDHAIHLSKKELVPVIWPLARFIELAEYRTFIGAKRLRTIGDCP